MAKPRNPFHLENTKIGMPVPVDTPKYYDEYIIKANEPLSIVLQSGGDQPVAGGTIYTPYQRAVGMFVPQAGQDYEVRPEWRGRYMVIGVRRLEERAEVVTTSAVALQKPAQCN